MCTCVFVLMVVRCRKTFETLIVLYMLYIFVLLVLKTVLGLDNWPELSFEAQVAIRSQRDVSYPLPIDQDTSYGVSLTSLVFETHGYTNDAMPFITGLFNVGVKIVVIDVYYNNFTSVWQLCPAPYPLNVTADATTTHTLNWNRQQYECQPGFTIDTIMKALSDFLGQTDTNMSANYIQILYRLRQFDYPPVRRNETSDLNNIYRSRSNPYSVYGNSSLGDTVSSLGSPLFTPNNLESFRSIGDSNLGPRSFYNQSNEVFPTLENFIFTMLKRVSVAVVYDEVTDSDIYNFTSSDKDTIFIDDSNMNLTTFTLEDERVVDECYGMFYNSSGAVPAENFSAYALSSHFRYIFDTDDTSFDETTFKAMIRCGLSPIVNRTEYELNDTESQSIGDIMNQFLPYSFWSWTETLLNIDSGDHDNFTEQEQDNQDQESNGKSQKAFKCVYLMKEGWEVGNCYEQHPYACQNIDDPFKWIIPKEKRQYFDTHAEDSCPKGYVFGVPKSSLEMISIMHEVVMSDDGFPVWIDVNDITVTNCFVTGGPYAECPYQKTVSTQALARIIAPSFVVAVVVLLLIFMEKVFRVNPIHTNRKRYWKKKINEFNKENENEGVPS